MRMTAFVAPLLLLVAAGAARAQETDEAPEGALRVVARPEDPRPLGVGALVPDLAWPGTDGKPLRLSTLDGRRVVVIAMFDPACPVSKRYAPRLGRMMRRVAEKGGTLIVCNTAGSEAVDAFKAAAGEHHWEGRTHTDPDGEWARRLGARSTTEVFVLDGARTLRYRGALDDQYGIGYSRDEPGRRWTESAVEAVLRDERPQVEATTPPGCRLSHEPHPEAPTTLTWNNRVSRIFQRSCMECHHKGGAGPFPLTTAAEVKRHGKMVSFMVDERAMPPWFATGGSLPMTTDHSLTDRERTDVLEWIAAGLPEGNPEEAPLPLHHTEGWSIGTPDLVIEAPEQEVPAEGTVAYRYLMVPVKLDEDRWVRAVEVRVSAPQVVHHVLAFLQYPPGHPGRERQREYRGGLEGYFAAMVPGQGVLDWGEGRAKLLPAGTVLVFQVHYTTNGTATRDTPRLGVRFAEGKPREEVTTLSSYTTRFSIPPRTARHPVKATRLFREDGRILAFLPHMHLRGTAFRYELETPDGERRTVLDIPKWDFNWQLVYRLREPLAVKAGSRLHVTGWFDNSTANPANPDPDREVRFGEQTWEEMMIGYFEWVRD